MESIGSGLATGEAAARERFVAGRRRWCGPVSRARSRRSARRPCAARRRRTTGGRSTTRRRRLEDLPVGQLAWFELENPRSIRRLDVWVGDDVIRRIQVVGPGEVGDSTTTTEFFDFGEPVRITPPTGG